jgi:integrase
LILAGSTDGVAGYPLFLTAARTGLRLGELMALKWANIDFQSRTLIVNQAMSRGEIGATKSGKAREVDMSRHLTDILRALHLQRRKEALAKGQSEISEFVFLTPAFTTLDAANFRHNVFGMPCRLPDSGRYGSMTSAIASHPY